MIAAVAAALVAAPAAFGGVVTVDDDGLAFPGNCDAIFPAPPTISLGVALAAPGDTVQVCPGTYVDNVLINSAIAVVGPEPFGVQNRCGPFSPPDPSQEAIVHPLLQGFQTIGLGAAGATVAGLVIEGNAANGIGTSVFASGYTIRSNVVQGNGLGIALSGNGQFPSTVTDNCVRGNATQGLLSPGPGGGVNIAGSRIDSNAFSFNGAAAVDLRGISNGVSVSGNKSTGNVSFLLAQTAPGGRFNGNISQGALGDGMRVDSSPGASINGNIVQSSGGDGISVSGPGLTIAGDIAQYSGGNGIRGRPGTAGARVIGSIAQFSGLDGIKLEQGTGGGMLNGNVAQFAGIHDCADLSTGFFGRPANSWNPYSNIGSTQNRPGLCLFARVTAPLFPILY